MRQTDYPALYRAADRTSLAGQIGYLWLTRVELALILGSAGLAALRVVLDLPQVSATAIAILMFGALSLRLANRVSRSIRLWFDGRAVAESVKTATWRFVMHLEPYSGTDTASTAVFLEALRQTLDARPELAQHIALDSEGKAVTAAMREFRSLPATERLDRYVVERIQDQLDWYRARSILNRRLATAWFWLGFAVQVSAVSVAIAAITAEVASALIGLFATAAAAVTAWAQLGRHDELGRSYGLAAHELMILRAALAEADPTDTEAVTDLVRNAEGAISREHTMWIAKRS